MATVLSVPTGPQLLPPPDGPAIEAGPPESRDGLLMRQAQLHRERGAAVLDRRPFELGAELTAATTALEVIDDADAERVRRGDAAAAQAAADQRARLAARVGGLTVAVSDSMRVAQRAMVAAVSNLERARALSQEIQELARRAGAHAAASLTREQQNKRFGSMIAEALWPIRSTGHSVGDLEWHVSAFSFADWEQSERDATARDVAAIVEGKLP
jgi:hypothetical protein